MRAFRGMCISFINHHIYQPFTHVPIIPIIPNKGEMRPPVKRVNVDFTLDMLKELDAITKELNISRQAVINTYLRQALDQHYIARQTQN